MNMKIRNSLRISGSCWQLWLKTMLLQIVIIAIVVALCVMLFGSLVPAVFDALNKLQLGEFLSDTITSIANGTFDAQEFSAALEQKVNEIKQAIESIPNLFNRIEISYVIMLVIMCVYRMLIAAPDLTTALSLNEFMTTNARRPFTWYFLKRFWTSFKFVLLQFLVTFPLDLIVIFASVGFYLLFLITFKWWTVIPAMIIALALYTLRFCLFAFWLPSIADGMSVKDALTNNFAKLPGHFWSVYYKTFIVLAILMIAVTVGNYFLLSEWTAVVSAILSLIAFYIIKCINMVEYFEANNRPYFSKRVNIYGMEDSRKSKEA